MIARVIYVESYKVNEEEGELPYDSINEVLPSLKEKALVKQ